jgi:hypothetical protein
MDYLKSKEVTLADGSKVNLDQIDFTIGMDDEGNRMKASFKDMLVGGEYSINTIENMLRATIEDKDGKLKAMGKKGMQIISEAQGALDMLQGYADEFAVNTARRSDAYKASVGFKYNPKFDEIIQEALEANIIHSGDTKYGRNVWAKAIKEGILETMLDKNGQPMKDQKGEIMMKVRDDKIGEWLSLNKSMGMKASKENIASKGAQAADAILKNLADKYDKK